MKQVQIVRLIMSLLFYPLSVLSFFSVRNYEGSWKCILVIIGIISGIIAICALYSYFKEFKKGFSFYDVPQEPLGKPGSGKGFHPFGRNGFVFVEGPIGKGPSVIRIYRKEPDILIFEDKVNYSLTDIKNMSESEFQKFIKEIGINN